MRSRKLPIVLVACLTSTALRAELSGLLVTPAIVARGAERQGHA